MFVKMHRVMCLLVTALLILLQISCQNNVEKQFLCKNEECSEPMGEFRVVKKYNPNSLGKIGANARDKGVILAKPEDRSTGLLKVKINDEIGFFPLQFVTILKEEKGNIAVKLAIPVNSGSGDVLSTLDPYKEKEKSTRLNDASVSDIQTDEINSTDSLPNSESSYSESTPSVVEDSSNKNEKLIPPTLDKHSTQDHAASEPLNNDQRNEDTGSSNKDSSYGQQNVVEELQNETVSQEKEEQVLSDILSKLEHTSAEGNESTADSADVASVKLGNTSTEVNESKTVNVIEESENITESSSNIIHDTIENSTQAIHEEKENINISVESVTETSSKIQSDAHVNEISSSSESISGTIESLNDSITTDINLKNIQNESLSLEKDTNAGSLPKAENPIDPIENLVQSSGAVKEDHVTSSDKVEANANTSSELNFSSLNVEPQNSSATADVSNNTEADVQQKPDGLETDHIASVSKEVQTDNEASPESNSQLPPAPPTMRSFPDNEESLVSKESEISIDEVINVAQSDNQNITSKGADLVNTTLDHKPNSTESDHVTEANLQHDSATPVAAPYEIPPPPLIETTTETDQNKLPIESVKNIESNESIPTESSPIGYSSPVSEDTAPSEVPEPYQYIKTQPYPSLFSNIATENQPAVTETIDQVSSQEIIEEDPKSVEQMSEQASSESVTVPVGIAQKQGLNDFIHSPRKEIHENVPAESINVPETLEEKSVYETIQEYLPDFGVLFYSFYETSKSFFDSQPSSQTESIETESCSADQFCGTDRLNSHMDKPEHSESETIYEIPLLGVVNRDQITLVSGILTTVFLATILLWWLMNYFTRSKKVGLLVSRINQLENKLLISTREVASLQEQLVEQDSVAESKQNAVDAKRIAEVYEHKINQYKKRTVELEDKVLYLEKELENVSNSALEMHKLLENSLATQAQSKLALDEVETLRTLAESQEIQIDELKREINSVITENECLKVDNDVNKSAIKKLEKECNAQTKKNVELSEKNRNLTLKLDKELENNSVLESNYKSEIYELRSKLEDVEMNLKRSEFQVQELQRAVLEREDGVQISSNDIQLKIQISTLEAMNNELSGQLNEQKNARRMLEDHVGDITKDLNNLKKSFENSEKERNQAVTKLQVLTQFFKEKEEQLKKELESKDKLSLERESKDQSLSQKLTLMREEISNLKIQNEELKKEVLDQEASYKVQLANAEQKTREHWFALRQAERKYKESQQEAAILRNKILVIETNMSSISHKADDKNSSGINGDIPGVSPVLYHPSLSPDLLPYPSPSDFIPPPPSPIASHSPDFFPPEPIYSPDERLPPLGGRRAPSPPLPISPDDDFGPPPPVMKFAPGRNHNVEPPIPGGYSRRTPPPSGRHRSQYKSRPPRSSIDSPSSGMSLESLDKSGR